MEANPKIGMREDSLISELARTVRRTTLDDSLAGPIENAVHNQSRGGASWWGVVEIVNPSQTYHHRLSKSSQRSKELERKLLFGAYVHEQLAPAWFRELPGFAASEAPVDGAESGLGGIRGRIDFRSDRSIIELKSTDLRHEAPADVWSQTPQDIEQLLLYALMTSREQREHFLVYYRHEAASHFRVFKCKIIASGIVKQHFLRRKGLLDTAVRQSDPSRLGRCRYFTTGCEFESNHVCACTSLDPIDTRELQDATEVVRDEAMEGQLSEARNAAPPLPRTRIRSWDLFTPRQAFKDLTDPQQFESREFDENYSIRKWIERKVGDSEISGRPVQMRLLGVDTELVPVGWSSMLQTRRTTKQGVSDRELPILIRVPKSPTPKEFSYISGPVLAQLALRCALLDIDEGILAFVFPGSGYQCLVFRVEFNQLEETRQKLASRLQALQRAIDASDPSQLPLCPKWIQSGCAEGCLCRGNLDSTELRPAPPEKAG